jgi:dihydrofolate synthase/folylpolyglutamate synthase
LTVADWLSRQEHSHPNAIDLGLERVSEVARRLGLLPWGTRAILVGGTNGKGSTATMIARLAQAAGVRTGLFTSPHLRRYQERIAIDGMPIDDTSLLAAFAAIEAARGTITLTFFEWNTLAALWVLRRHQVELAVLEVGLGGRLDATNMVDADVSVLCSVGIDHTEWLGPDVESIGREKAGIFRGGRPAIFAAQDPPRSVRAVAQDVGATWYGAGTDYQFASQPDGRWRFQFQDLVLDDLPPPGIRGPRQVQNAAAALCALTLLGRADDGRSYCPDRATLARVLAGLELAGRLQTVPGRPPWLLDVAHNPDAAQVLAEQLRATPCEGRKLLLFGMLADKDVAAVSALLAPEVDGWVLAGITESARGLSQEQLAMRMAPGLPILGTAASVQAGCDRLRALASPQDLLIVCGSFHMVGPALDWLGL